MSETGNVEEKRERYIKQLPGQASGPGAILEVRGLPKGARVMTISVSRKNKWLTDTGWVDRKSELPVTLRKDGARRLLLEISKKAAAQLSPGNQVTITIPGYDLSDVLVWRSLNPHDAHKLAGRRSASASSMGFNKALLFIPLGLAVVAAVVGFTMFGGETNGQAGSPEEKLASTAAGQEGDGAWGKETVPAETVSDAPVDDGTLCQGKPATPARGDAWSAELFNRNLETSLREGRRRMFMGDANGARTAFAEAVCHSPDAARRAASFLDPNVNPEAGSFGEGGRALAIEIYKLAQERWSEPEAGHRLSVLEARK